jgi:predicted transcriptional regulator
MLVLAHEGFTVPEIAESVGVDEKTVRRALERMAQTTSR